jgi:hypothetical protein
MKLRFCWDLRVSVYFLAADFLGLINMRRSIGGFVSARSGLVWCGLVLISDPVPCGTW